LQVPTAAQKARLTVKVPRHHSTLLRAIDPLRLRLVVEVGRHQSITRAAEICGIGQPMASTHLRALELASGQHLFERAGRGTRLTDAGRVVAQHAAVVLSTLDSLHEELASLEGAQTGTLRLMSCHEFGDYVLPAVLSAFAADRPQVEIHVRMAHSGEVMRAIARGDAQLGIAGQTRHVEGVTIEPLMRDDLVGIAPPAGVEAGPRIVTAEALAEMALLVSSTDSSSRGHTERLLSALGCRPARHVELDSVEAVKRAVQSGLGAAFVSRLAVADELARGQLRTLTLVGAETIERWLVIVRPRHRRPTPVAQVFEHTLRRLCGQPVPYEIVEASTTHSVSG
jgi:DNA-binding transcriptional LysR family regulator